VRDYYELCKPRVVMLIVFTAVVGMFLAAPGLVAWQPLVFATLGITLAAASAAAVNQMVETKIDARMARTNRRPLVTGSLGMPEAMAFAALLGVAGEVMLYWLVNPLTALLTLLSLLGYAVVYTIFLKRSTSQNIVLGGAAGAAPPILGWTAVTAHVTLEPLLLFLIIFIWTPPHFWALAIDKYKEYAAVDMPMLPVTHGLAHTRTEVLLYTIALVPVSLSPFFIGMSGWLYLAGAVVLDAVFVYYAVKLKFAPRPGLGMKTFGYSIIYLLALFSFLLLDHYVKFLVGY
jgi:protoheme IX farnesyltransferase